METIHFEWVIMSRVPREPEFSGLCVFALLLSFLPVFFIFSMPVFLYGIEWAPVSIFFGTMFFIPIITCGFFFRGRPLIQSTYHGEHTPVMDELYDEIAA